MNQKHILLDFKMKKKLFLNTVKASLLFCSNFSLRRSCKIFEHSHSHHSTKGQDKNTKNVIVRTHAFFSSIPLCNLVMFS